MPGLPYGNGDDPNFAFENQIHDFRVGYGAGIVHSRAFTLMFAVSEEDHHTSRASGAHDLSKSQLDYNTIH